VYWRGLCAARWGARIRRDGEWHALGKVGGCAARGGRLGGSGPRCGTLPASLYEGL